MTERRKRRYFAVVRGKMGYALDYYPEEAAAYRREQGVHIIGDFGTSEKAQEAVEAALLKRAAHGESEAAHDPACAATMGGQCDCGGDESQFVGNT